MPFIFYYVRYVKKNENGKLLHHVFHEITPPRDKKHSTPFGSKKVSEIKCIQTYDLSDVKNF